jgi:hypothetical protein
MTRRNGSEVFTSGLSHLTAPILMIVVVSTIVMAVKPEFPDKARSSSSTKTFDKRNDERLSIMSNEELTPCRSSRKKLAHPWSETARLEIYSPSEHSVLSPDSS